MNRFEYSDDRLISVVNIFKADGVSFFEGILINADDQRTVIEQAPISDPRLIERLKSADNPAQEFHRISI